MDFFSCRAANAFLLHKLELLEFSSKRNQKFAKNSLFARYHLLGLLWRFFIYDPKSERFATRAALSRARAAFFVSLVQSDYLANNNNSLMSSLLLYRFSHITPLESPQ